MFVNKPNQNIDISYGVGKDLIKIDPVMPIKHGMAGRTVWREHKILKASERIGRTSSATDAAEPVERVIDGNRFDIRRRTI